LNIFDYRDRLTDDYASYVESFIQIRDRAIRSYVQQQLDQGVLWPDPLLQLNPLFAQGDSIDELVAQGVLHQECTRIFRKKSQDDPAGRTLRLHKHQESIASSNHLMRNPLILKQWREIARTVVVVEMEAAGVYQAAQAIERQYPVMAIRGISDIVGLERDPQWTAYACQTAAAFAYAFLLTDSLDPPKSASAALSRATLLLVTTNELEARTVLALFGQGPEQKPARRFIGQNVYYALGTIGDANVFMVRMEPDQPAEILWEGVQALAPSTVIAVGLAFGLHPARLRLGDIVVSKQVLRYEIRRISTSIDGGPEYHFRLQHLSAPRRLYDRFRDAALDWQGTEVHFGPLLSGSIVIAESEFRDRLLQLDSALLGGDVNANLYSFMAERNVNWIAVKSICAWAAGIKIVEM